MITYALVLCPSIALSQATPMPQSIYWQQRVLFIPYKLNGELPEVRNIAEVQLLISRTGTNDWSVLQSAKPNVQGFSYHAPHDGPYWFALKHLNAQGQPLDGATVVPQLQILIDTQPPQLALSASPDGADQVAIRYDAADGSLQAQSLILEARPAGGLWNNITISPPEVSHANRVAGTVRITVPAGTNEVEIRGSVADGTGQRGQAFTTVSVSGPSLTPPALQPNIASSQPSALGTTHDPFQSGPKLAQNWPATNAPPIAGFTMTPATTLPSNDHPYVNASESHPVRRTPAKFAVDGADSEANPADNFAPNLIDANQPTRPVESVKQDWASTGSASGAPMLVNARTFDVEYDLDSVGPWGVAKVELWGTQDDGATWQSYGIDSDNRSPARVTVPHAGTFGFRIIVEGANGTSSVTPAPGVEPELVVKVDLQSPTVEIVAVEPGEGNLSDHLRIRWQASDDNLEQRPIGLFYSSFPNGPWSTVAAGLENTGSYVWRIERHVPGRFYLRIEARDTAGNVAAFQTAEPIELNRPQPTGTLRSVRPISGVPTVGK